MRLQVSGLKSRTSGSLAAFERMEQKVVAMEAEADAVGQVCSPFVLFCFLSCIFQSMLGYNNLFYMHDPVTVCSLNAYLHAVIVNPDAEGVLTLLTQCARNFSFDKFVIMHSRAPLLASPTIKRACQRCLA